MPQRVTELIKSFPWQLLAAIGALALLGLFMAGRSAASAARARRLGRQRQELRDDVGALQAALLPAVPDHISNVAVSAAYRPADGPAAGGDFHDVFPLAEGRLGVIVGDVSGHGREALAPTALIHYTVRAHLEAGLSPRAALRRTDEALEDKLGDNFATVLAATYDPGQSSLEYATAGHPVPLVLGEGVRPSVATLTPTPIGLGPRTGERQTRLSVPAGSRIWLFTDGVVEAREQEGILLGREGLTAILGRLDEGIEADALLDELARRATTGGDDLTACLLRPAHAAGCGEMVETLEIDQAVSRAGSFEEFLLVSGLSKEDAGRALAASRARVPSGALIRVARSRSGASWEIVRADLEPEAQLGSGAGRESGPERGHAADGVPVTRQVDAGCAPARAGG